MHNMIWQWNRTQTSLGGKRTQTSFNRFPLPACWLVTMEQKTWCAATPAEHDAKLGPIQVHTAPTATQQLTTRLLLALTMSTKDSESQWETTCWEEEQCPQCQHWKPAGLPHLDRKFTSMVDTLDVDHGWRRHADGRGFEVMWFPDWPGRGQQRALVQWSLSAKLI